MQRMRILLLLLVSASLSACSNKPSDAEIKEQMLGHILNVDSQNVFSVENFKKTNGFEESKNTYIADVKYDLVFKISLKEMSQAVKEDQNTAPFNALAGGLAVMALKMQYGDVKAGDKINKEEKVTFIKTENGWRIKE